MSHTVYIYIHIFWQTSHEVAACDQFSGAWFHWHVFFQPLLGWGKMFVRLEVVYSITFDNIRLTPLSPTIDNNRQQCIFRNLEIYRGAEHLNKIQYFLLCFSVFFVAFWQIHMIFVARQNHDKKMFCWMDGWLGVYHALGKNSSYKLGFVLLVIVYGVYKMVNFHF